MPRQHCRSIGCGTSQLVDPHNSDHQQTQKMVETLGIEQARLEAAQPRLQELLGKAEQRELRQALLPEFNRVVEHRNRCCETLFTLYVDFVEQFVPLLNEAIKLNGDIRQINAKTHGTKLTLIPCLAEYIIAKLVLPSEQGGQDYWPDPRQANAVAVQWSEAMAQVCASPLRQAAYSPDWTAAKQADDERKIAEWTRRNELLERQQEEVQARISEGPTTSGER